MRLEKLHHIKLRLCLACGGCERPKFLDGGMVHVLMECATVFCYSHARHCFYGASFLCLWMSDPSRRCSIIHCRGYCTACIRGDLPVFHCRCDCRRCVAEQHVGHPAIFCRARTPRRRARGRRLRLQGSHDGAQRAACAARSAAQAQRAAGGQPWRGQDHTCRRPGPCIRQALQVSISL